MTITLNRAEITSDGVFGALWMPSGNIYFTVEDDWKDNAPGESCIPAGTYTLARTMYHKGGYETFEIAGVPGRARILIHKGNTENDVMGCVAIGTRFGTLLVPDEDSPGRPVVGKRSVVESGEAFRRFMREMQGVDKDVIVVRWSSGLP